MQQHLHKGSFRLREWVPILIQPEGWMQQINFSDSQRGVFLFQSSSNPKAGCNIGDIDQVLVIGGSNPHPTRRLDATQTNNYERNMIRFQSSSNPKAGCNDRFYLVPYAPTKKFQSSSNPKAGCNLAKFRDHHNRGVPILIQPEGWMQLSQGNSIIPRGGGFQSSSNPKAGCNV